MHIALWPSRETSPNPRKNSFFFSKMKQKTYIAYLQSKCKLSVKKTRLTKDQCQISFALALAHEFCNTCADLPSFKCKSNFACNEVIV